MATIWKGSLTFGLVNIPVQLQPAVRADHISFRLLYEDDLSPVKYERVCQADGEPVPWNEIVKGYEDDSTSSTSCRSRKSIRASSRRRTFSCR